MDRIVSFQLVDFKTAINHLFYKCLVYKLPSVHYCWHYLPLCSVALRTSASLILHSGCKFGIRTIVMVYSEESYAITAVIYIDKQSNPFDPFLY